MDFAEAPALAAAAAAAMPFLAAATDLATAPLGQAGVPVGKSPRGSTSSFRGLTAITPRPSPVPLLFPLISTGAVLLTLLPPAPLTTSSCRSNADLFLPRSDR